MPCRRVPIITSLRLVEVPVLKVASLVQDEDDVMDRQRVKGYFKHRAHSILFAFTSIQT